MIETINNLGKRRSNIDIMPVMKMKNYIQNMHHILYIFEINIMDLYMRFEGELTDKK
jgi:hypothetical protein